MISAFLGIWWLQYVSGFAKPKQKTKTKQKNLKNNNNNNNKNYIPNQGQIGNVVFSWVMCFNTCSSLLGLNFKDGDTCTCKYKT